MPDDSQPAPQPQVTIGTKSHDWKKVSLTILIILVVAGLIVAAYWFLVLNKTSDNSDLTGPVPKVTTKTSTESAKEATKLATEETSSTDETAGWKTFSGDAFLPGEVGSTKISFKYPNDYTQSSDEYARVVFSTTTSWRPVKAGNMVVFAGVLELSRTIQTQTQGYTGSSSKTSLDGYVAERHTSTSDTIQTINYITEDIGKNNWGFEFRCIYVSPGDADFIKICDNMASSLKFL